MRARNANWTRVPAIAAVAASAAASAFAADGAASDPWDVSQGTVVTSTSGTVGGSRIEDLFGASLSAVEPATTIFKDGMPAGFVHFVEWRTAAPVQVDGFTLRANDDFAASGARGFSAFRLFARNTGSGEFDLVFTYTAKRNPYGDFLDVSAPFAAVTAQEFRAEFVQAGPAANGGPRVRELDGPVPYAPVNGCVVPFKVAAKRNAQTPEKSRLTVSGLFDTGAPATAFGTPITLDAGPLHLAGAAPTQKGKAFTLAQGGFAFSVTPSPVGSSRAKFKLAFSGDISDSFPLDDFLTLGYADASATIGAVAELERGKFALKRGGELRSPHFNLVKCKATIAGDSADKLALVLAVNRSENGVPTVPFDVALRFGGPLDVTMPADAFRRAGNRFTLTRPVGGIRKAVIDFDSGLASFAGKGLDLGAFADGSNVVDVGLRLGADRRVTTVRLAKIGTSLRY